MITQFNLTKSFKLFGVSAQEDFRSRSSATVARAGLSTLATENVVITAMQASGINVTFVHKELHMLFSADAFCNNIQPRRLLYSLAFTLNY